MADEASSDNGEYKDSVPENMPETPAQGGSRPETAEVSELSKRVEDLEDIVMVENAGLVELKKIMENLGNRIDNRPSGGQAQPNVQVQIPAEVTNKIHEVDSLKARMNEMVGQLSELRGQMTTPLGQAIPEDSVRKYAESAAKRQSDEIRSKIDQIERTKSVVESRIGSLESSLNKLAQEFQNTRSVLMKVGSIDKMAESMRDIQGKVDEYRNLDADMKRLSNQVQGIYSEMKQNMDRMHDTKVQQIVPAAPAGISDERVRDMQQNIDWMKDELKRVVAEAREPMSVVNIEISDLMSRLIATETRISNIERVLEQFGKMHPVIIE